MSNIIQMNDWEWTQDNFGFSVIFHLIDLVNLKSIDIENFDFYVNVQRGESIKNIYKRKCNIVDAEEKKVEYVVAQGDLSIGDEYYYIELQAYHKDTNPEDTLNDESKISSQQVVRVFVRRKKET